MERRHLIIHTLFACAAHGMGCSARSSGPFANGASDGGAVPGPVIQDVWVVGRDAPELRQGAAANRINVEGLNLGSVTRAILLAPEGSGAPEVPLLVLGGDAGLITLKADIPHGQAPGAYALRVLADDTGGVADTLGGAVVVTPIHARADAGPAPELGTRRFPFSHVSTAVAQAQAGDTVVLDGFFTDEPWPIVLPEGVVVQNGPASAVLIGPGVATGVTAVEIVDEAAVVGIQIAGFATGIRVASSSTAAVRLVRVVSYDCAQGVRVESGSVNWTAGTAVNGDVGLALTGGSLVARGGMLTTNTGIEMSGGALRVRDTWMLQLGIGVEVQAGDLIDLGSAGDPGNNTIHASSAAVLDARPARDGADGAVITLTGTALNGVLMPSGTAAIGPDRNGAFWTIVNANNRLAFEPVSAWPRGNP